MTWFVRHAHMFGTKIVLHPETVSIGKNGELPALKPEQEARCQRMPNVFMFVPDQTSETAPFELPDEAETHIPAPAPVTSAFVTPVLGLPKGKGKSGK